MTTRCSIELYEQSHAASLEDLDGSDLDVFFALGIVNPFGPTLTFVAAAGKPSPGASLPLVKVMLNPFTQTVDQVGRFTVGDTWSPLRDLEPLFALDYGSCPTLLLVSNQVDEETRQQLTARVFASFEEEAVQVWRSIERHFGDPWKRVSEAMSSGLGDHEEMRVEDAAQRLAQTVADERHVRSELQAFSYAWRGSIEETGIGERIKQMAMQPDTFQKFFFDRVVPRVWLPEFAEQAEQPPKHKAPERLKLESLDDLERILSSQEWRNYSEELLLDLLRALFVCYDMTHEAKYVAGISSVYRFAIDSGMEADTRMLLQSEMCNRVEAKKAGPTALLPFLVLEGEHSIASKAAIDFVSSSGYVQGELYAIAELRNLFKHGLVENPGAVFGALVSMGDPQVIELAEEVKSCLKVEDVRHAARVHTGFPQHRAIQFWLAWARELVSRTADEDQAKFGSCASALILVLEHDGVGRVCAGRRNFPSQQAEKPVVIEQEWSVDQYAELLAPDLYELEARESAPRVFSDVLRSWGLKPQAALTEQFIPPEGARTAPSKPLRDLSPQSNRAARPGLLGRLFGTEGNHGST